MEKNGNRRRYLVPFLALLVMTTLIALIGCTSSDKSKKDSTPKKVAEVDEGKDSDKKDSDIDEESDIEEPEKETKFRKGETAEMNDIQVTMTSCKLGKGSEYNKPDDGNAYLLAEFEIKNNSDDELTVSSIMSFEAYADDYKLDYSFGAIMEAEGNQLDGSIAPGKKMKGWIGWEVPEDFKAVEVHFTDNVWSSDKFVFLIER